MKVPAPPQVVPHKVQYRVRPITRFVVTRYVQGIPSENGNFVAGSSERGEYSNEYVAHEVARALCKAEHEALGWPIGDERIVYPEPWQQADEEPSAAA